MTLLKMINEVIAEEVKQDNMSVDRMAYPVHNCCSHTETQTEVTQPEFFYPLVLVENPFPSPTKALIKPQRIP